MYQLRLNHRLPLRQRLADNLQLLLYAKIHKLEHRQLKTLGAEALQFWDGVTLILQLAINSFLSKYKKCTLRKIIHVYNSHFRNVRKSHFTSGTYTLSPTSARVAAVANGIMKPRIQMYPPRQTAIGNLRSYLQGKSCLDRLLWRP